MNLEQWGFLAFIAAWACCGSLIGVLGGWSKGRAAENSFRWTFLLVAGWGMFALALGGFWPWPGSGVEKYLIVILAGFASSIGAFGGCKVARRNKVQACMLSGVLAGTIAPAILYFWL